MFESFHSDYLFDYVLLVSLEDPVYKKNVLKFSNYIFEIPSKSISKFLWLNKISMVLALSTEDDQMLVVYVSKHNQLYHHQDSAKIKAKYVHANIWVSTK